MKKISKALAVAAVAGAAAAYMPAASAVPVGLELVLLVDVSGSVDATEYGLQKTGYVNAFNSAAVQNAILGSQLGKIAVTYVEWSGNNEQSQQVGWTLIDSVAEIRSDHNRALRVEGIIVNQYQARARLPVQLVEELRAEGMPIMDAFLSASVRIRESHHQALPMIHLDPRHKLTGEFAALYDLLSVPA